VQFGVDGTFVYVMDGDKTVRIRSLKTGPGDENSTVITQGLAAGDRVVLEGTDRLKDGSAVEVVNDSKDVPTTPGGKLQGQPAKDKESGESADTATAQKGNV